MKKLTILFAALMFITIWSCKEDDPVVHTIVGGWKPIQMVKNTVDKNNVITSSETVYYNDCQQGSRWQFNENMSGKIIVKTWYNNDTCVQTRNSDFTYNYDKKSGVIDYNYVTGSERNTVTNLTEKTMNLKYEQILPSGGYVSETYSLVRVN